VAPYLDPVLKAQCGFTLDELFAPASAALNITAKDLIGMTAGIGDYNDDQLKSWTFLFPDDDLLPCDYLNLANRKLSCNAPPCPGHYSSIGFVVAGFLAQGLEAANGTWSSWDQFGIIPATRKHLYNETIFMGTGRCHEHPRVASQWIQPAHSLEKPDELAFYDLLNYSCLNGWSMGNLAASGKDLAMFFRDVFGGNDGDPWRVVKRASSDLMRTSLKPMTSGFGGFDYGLGVTFFKNW
jgi:hypothetical protein